MSESDPGGAPAPAAAAPTIRAAIAHRIVAGRGAKATRARDAQLAVSLAIVAALTVLGGGLMVTAYLLSNWAVASMAVGTIIGALATALNAPTGISNALKAAGKDGAE